MADWKKKGKMHQQMGMHMEKGQFKNALKVSQKLLKFDPQDCDTLYNMSIIYTHLGNVKKAEQCNLKILAINPKDTDALINMAQVNEMRGNTKKAEGYYSKALESRLSRIFRVDKLWDLALEKYKNDRTKLKQIADQCVFRGDIEKLINLEARTKILGPQHFKVASQLSSVLNKFQMLVSSPPVLAPFPEMFFASDEVWEEFIKQVNVDVGVSLFSKQGLQFDYEQIKIEVLEKINTLSIKVMMNHIIKGLEVLAKEGKYETTEQMFEKAEKNKGMYEVERMN